MDVKIEETGACRNRIQVTLPREQVQKAFEKNYKELQGTIRIKGFRPGKVPRSFIVRRFGDEVAKQVKADLIEEALEKAIEDNKLEPIGRPDIDFGKVLVDPEQDLTFEAIVEVRPTFELGEYTDIEVERPESEITDDDVQAELLGLRRRVATLEPIEGDEVGEEDVLIGKATLIAGDRKVIEDQTITIAPETKAAGGIQIEDLRPKAMEAGVGGTATFDVTVPAYFPDEEVRGSTGKLILQVEEAKKVVLPEANDAFAEQLDFDDMKELEEKIRESLQAQKDAAADRGVEERVIEKLLEATPFSAPQGMLDKQMEQITGRTRMRLEFEGKTSDEIDEAIAEEVERQKDNVENSLRSTFLLDAIAKKEKIFVTEDELGRHFEVLAAREGRDPAEIREQYENREMLAELRYHMREAKTRALLREKAKIS